MLEERSWLVDCREETQEERAEAIMIDKTRSTDPNGTSVSVMMQCNISQLISHR